MIPLGILQDNIIHHQVKYLGLMENLRVRRAGFCYRRPFAVFLGRYKSLCPKTWPVWRGQYHGNVSLCQHNAMIGSEKEGIRELCVHLGYTPEQFKIGWLVTERCCGISMCSQD